MSLKFRRKRRLNIEHNESIQRPVFVIDYKGREINQDITALCYLRAAKDVLLSKGLPAIYQRLRWPNTEEGKEPYSVYVDGAEGIIITKTYLIKFSEEIHTMAERLYNFYYQSGNSRRILDIDWRLIT